MTSVSWQQIRPKLCDRRDDKKLSLLGKQSGRRSSKFRSKDPGSNQSLRQG